MGPIFCRNHSQVYPHICMPNLVMIGPAVWPPILDRHTHTHTQNLYYIDIDIYIYIYQVMQLSSLVEHLAIFFTENELITNKIYNVLWMIKITFVKKILQFVKPNYFIAYLQKKKKIQTYSRPCDFSKNNR